MTVSFYLSDSSLAFSGYTNATDKLNERFSINFLGDLDFRTSDSSISKRQWLWNVFIFFEKSINNYNCDGILITRSCYELIKLICNKYFLKETNISDDLITVTDEINLNEIEKLRSLIINSGEFIPYTINNTKKDIMAEATFSPTNILPIEIPISTPLTFPMNKDDFVLTFDKNDWWNPLGGHVENDETWIEALNRESREEAGVDIKDIELVGYIKIKTIHAPQNTPYPDVSLIPMTVSKVVNYSENWTPMETSMRGVFNRTDTFNKLKVRTDGGQMLQIFSYILFLIDNKIID